MKNKFIKTVFYSVLIATIFGCNEDFLDKTPTEFISVDDIAKTGELDGEVLNGTLRGIYSMMITPGTGGLNVNEDFGQKGFDIFSDLLSADMALAANNYNRYGTFANLLATVDYTNLANYMPWRYYYRVIRSTNLVIESLGGNAAIPSTDDQAFSLGQAKALRAYAYFYLTQYFAESYNPNATVLPLYLNADDPIQGQAPMSEIYNAMIADLSSSIELLEGFTRPNKTIINNDVAKALLAYVYSSMDTNDSYTKAMNLADEVIASGYPIMTGQEVTGGFTSTGTPGWFWGFDVTLAQGLSLTSWWGQMDHFTYSYQWAGDRKAIDQGLYDLIRAGDIRKTQFDAANSLQPRGKFYNLGRVAGGQRNIEDDYVYMRISEMYLLSAEMASKIGQDEKAKNRLSDLLSKRFADTSNYDYIQTLSGTALQNEIYLQTRIELWGEGKSYLAMKRNKATITRGSNHVFHAGSSYSYDSDELTWEIPRAETLNNPFIDNN